MNRARLPIPPMGLAEHCSQVLSILKSANMKTSDFDYELPDELIAHYPIDSRSAKRSNARTDDPCKASGAGFTKTKLNDSRDSNDSTRGDGYISSIVVHPTDESIIYTTTTSWYDEHVWKSTDCGETWTSLDLSLIHI